MGLYALTCSWPTCLRERVRSLDQAVPGKELSSLGGLQGNDQDEQGGVIIKTWEGVLLLANSGLSLHRFSDAGRRHEPAGSETKDMATHGSSGWSESREPSPQSSVVRGGWKLRV